ncbi:MAG: hypothetical protein OXC15_13650 [Rhodospirillaceae bacterium]|nr:hypothetical protein [Rhodospirillaceae bacterium]
MTVGATLPPGRQTGDPAPVMPQAAPAYSETSPPLPTEYEKTPSEAAAEFSSWGTCEIETLLVVLILTVCVSLLLALGALTFKVFKGLWAEFRYQSGQAPDRGRR